MANSDKLYSEFSCLLGDSQVVGRLHNKVRKIREMVVESRTQELYYATQ